MEAERFSAGELRSENRDELNAIINEAMLTESTETWVTRLNEAGVPCGEINNIDQVFASPQVQHLGIARDMTSQERGATQVVGQPIKMSGAESQIRRPPPTCGQHTDEVLSELGLESSEIDQLREQGAI